jgi:hypothetical protein
MGSALKVVCFSDKKKSSEATQLRIVIQQQHELQRDNAIS